MHSNGTKVRNIIHLSEKLAKTVRQKQTRPVLFIKIKFDTNNQNLDYNSFLRSSFCLSPFYDHSEYPEYPAKE